jgi:carbonic anhydrase
VPVLAHGTRREGAARVSELLLQGLRRYESDLRPRYQDVFATLASGQSPHALVITCADSRVVPNLIASADPGEIFTVRNIANLVPTFSEDGDSSVGAAIAYAVGVLHVRDIVVCGHSSCGGANALLAPPHSDPSVRRWLDPARSILDVLESRGPLDPTRSAGDNVSQLSTLRQLDNLRTHPSVRDATLRGEMALHAWWFDIPTGEVLAYSPADGRYVTAIDVLEGDPSRAA